MEVKRYDMKNIVTGIGVYKEMTEVEKGDYVLFEDIKHLLETSHNSDYAKCSICGNKNKTITLCFEHYQKIKDIQAHFA